MELSFLGITYQSENIPDGIIMEELIALAFAAPCFTASSAKSILSADLKQVDIFKLRKLLIKDVINLRQNLDTNSDHNFDFSEKRSEWISIFGQIDSSDISCLSRFKLDPELFCKTKSIEHIPDTFNNPNEMFTYVSKFVKGQEQVLKTLSIYYFDHYLRVRKNISMPKISFVLIGKTGEGKSYTCSKFAEIINVPIIKINLVDIVPEGFVGKTICKELSFAYHKYNKDINVLKNSIIEFSEIDKICSNYLSNNYRTTIQAEILRFFEKGNTIRFQEDHDYSKGKFAELPVDNLMIVFNGAFAGIETIIQERVKSNKNNEYFDSQNILSNLNKDDLVSYGLMPELLSRISTFEIMNPLSVDDIFNIIKNSPESDLLAHLTKCNYLNIKLQFTDEALFEIAQITYNHGLGARNTNSVINNVMEEIYSDFQSYQGKEVLIDKAYFLKRYYISKYNNIFESFDKNEDLNLLATKYNITIDEVLDIYNFHKSLICKCIEG